MSEPAITNPITGEGLKFSDFLIIPAFVMLYVVFVDSSDTGRLGISSDHRQQLLDDELPVTCRLCETGKERLRIPGQFLCETCAKDEWGEEQLNDVLERVRDEHGLSETGGNEEA